ITISSLFSILIISIITGEQLISKCNEYLYNIYPIYIDKNGTWLTGKDLKDIDNIKDGIKKTKVCSFMPNDKGLYIKKGSKFKKLVNIDMAFVCLHGLRGEDGTVAGILELSKIPYSSSSICASSVCMDKCVFKTFAKGLGVDIVPGFMMYENEYLQLPDVYLGKINEIGFPIIIKPSRQGSSIGIEVCKTESELDEKIKNAFKYDKKILIEKYLDVEKEVNLAVFESKGEYILSSTEEPVTKEEILSFDNKYRKNSGGFETIKRIVPAVISKENEEKLKTTALLVYRSLEMFGIVRFDFILDKEGKLYLNEVNTIPGSMANYLFDKEKYAYPVLIELMINSAVFRYSKMTEVERVFDTDVLENDFDGFKK
ncbi:MAG: ATP-grasp domain-containing protein, partial [Christensenellales bacterium]